MPNIKILFTIAMTTGCATSSHKKDNGIEQDINANSEKINRKEFDKLQLKTSKTWAKIQEIEDQMIQQKEIIKIIEKSLNINLKEKQKETIKKEESRHINTWSENDKKDLARAHKLFKEEKYDESANIFIKINGRRPKAPHPLYWAGRSFFKMKKFKEAKYYFSQSLEKSKVKTLKPNAIYYLARSEINLGLHDEAKKNLKNLIQEYPYEIASEAGRNLLSQLEKSSQ